MSTLLYIIVTYTHSITFREYLVVNHLYFIIYLIRTPFNITYFVISGGYYCSLFKYIIELIIQLRLYNKAPDLTLYNA